VLGCVIFFPRLATLVNRGIRGGVEPPLCCADCAMWGVIGGLRGAVSPPLRGLGQRPGKIIFLDPILGGANLPMVLCMVFTHGFWTQWFSVHGIGCFGMYIYVL